MITCPQNLRRGAVLFIKSDTPVSALIRLCGRQMFSHVAPYLGNGRLIESAIGGVQINLVSTYLNNPVYSIEMRIPRVSDTQLDGLCRTAETHFRQRYDYALLFGDLLSRLIHRSRKYLGLFNHGDAWICSELIANGLEVAGVNIGLPPSQVTPDDLYQLLEE